MPNRPADQYLVGEVIMGASTHCLVCEVPFNGSAAQYKQPGGGFVYACTDKFACQVRSGKQQRVIDDPVLQIEAEREVAIAEGFIPEGWKACKVCEQPFKPNNYKQEYCKNPCQPLSPAQRRKAKAK